MSGVALKSWALVACLGVNFYLLGVMVLFAAVTYPQFGAVPQASFTGLYQAFTGRIGAPVVLWEFAALLTTLVLYGARPEAVPLWVVHVLLGLGLAYFGLTFGWHLPAHRPLAAGDNSSASLAPLLLSQWVRTVVQGLRVALLAWAAAQSMR